MIISQEELQRVAKLLRAGGKIKRLEVDASGLWVVTAQQTTLLRGKRARLAVSLVDVVSELLGLDEP